MDQNGHPSSLRRQAIPALILLVGVCVSFYAFRDAGLVDDRRVRNVLKMRLAMGIRDFDDGFRFATASSQFHPLDRSNVSSAPVGEPNAAPNFQPCRRLESDCVRLRDVAPDQSTQGEI